MNLHNDPTRAKAYTRRMFLRQSALLASAAVTVPAFIQSSAQALPSAGDGLSSIPGVDEDRILVIIQLSGGNDGLNTVVPFRDDAYYRNRPVIGIKPNQLHILSQNGVDLGLHESMTGIRELYDQGQCAIIQGVGYPNPNRSHFASMDIWHTGELSGTGDGWIGRYIDAQCCGYGKGEGGRPEREEDAVEPPIAIGTEVPLMLTGRRSMPISFESPDLYTWSGSRYSEDLVEEHRKLTRLLADEKSAEKSSNNAFLLRTAMDAQISSDMIRKAVDIKPLVNYPNTQLGEQLAMIGAMIRAGLKTRVYYASHGGFDTHANQPGGHSRQLGQFASAVHAFQQDLAAQGNDTRVITMAFSEFGRRVKQNASNGTDHGTAAPMFLFGPKVRPGFHSRHPSLTNLDQGDLRYTCDFRSVYAEILDTWLSTPSNEVLNGRFRHLRVLSS